MPISRIRVRLTAYFALAFFLSLLALNVGLYLYLRAQLSHQLTRRLQGDAKALVLFIENEQRETPGSLLEVAAADGLKEFPTRNLAFAVMDQSGVRTAVGGNLALQPLLPGRLVPGNGEVWERRSGNRHPVRFTIWPVTGSANFQVVSAASTEQMNQELESIAVWLGIAVPFTMLLSLVGGYLLAGRALLPVRELGARVSALDAEGLDTRLAVGATPDELDTLASQFNGLLDRLVASREANRKFLHQAAHQIRTPLTLVLGEASLSLERNRSDEDRITTLRRIRLAAEQMRRRVDDLFLLAQAGTGERVDLTQDVELDGVALESTDLMRSRFTEAGHRLELAGVLPVVVRGNEDLLREALIELLENACRYGDAQVPIRVGVARENGYGVLSVTSGGAAVALGAMEDSDGAARDRGIGLQVVRWIAKQHGGSLQYQFEPGGENCFRLAIPAVSLGLS